MKPDIKETFLYMCDVKLFEFQWQILRLWLKKECLGPGFVSMLPLSIIIQESCQIYLSKLHVIRKFVALLMYILIMKTLSLIFLWQESKIPEKNEIKIGTSNLVKHKLSHMNAHDGAATEQQVELLKKTWNLP